MSGFPDERAAVIGALDRAAAAFEAEVAAVVRGGCVEASIGFRGGEVPAAEFAAAAERGEEPHEIAGLGSCWAAGVPLEGDAGGTLLLARLGDDGFSPEELNLLRAMARVLQLAASGTAGAAFVPVLRALARERGAALGVVWLTDEPGTALPAPAFGATPPPRARTLRCLRAARSRTGSWDGSGAKARPAWEDGGSTSATGASGTRTGPALAFPIADDADVVGVIELVGGDLKRPDPAALEMLTGVGAQVSQFLTRRRAKEQLAHQALHDALTGLPNRTLLLDRIAHANDRAIRTGTSIAVLFLDIDRFKNVNDSLGHQAGDGLLVAFAERLTGIIRATDSVARSGGTVARLAGDEFVVLCEDLDPSTMRFGWRSASRMRCAHRSRSTETSSRYRSASESPRPAGGGPHPSS